MRWKLDTPAMRGEHAWTGAALAKAYTTMLSGNPEAIMSELRRDYGEKLAEAHMIRVMVAIGFIVDHAAMLSRAKLVTESPTGVTPTAALLQALAISKFTQDESEDPDDPRWTYHPADVFKLAQKFRNEGALPDTDALK